MRFWTLIAAIAFVPFIASCDDDDGLEEAGEEMEEMGEDLGD